MATRQIPERDWQEFRKIHPLALERFSKQILEEIEDVTSDQDLSAHEKYGKSMDL